MRINFSNQVVSKFAGICAALAIMPMAVACDSPSAETTGETSTEVATDVDAEPSTSAAADGGTIVDVATAAGSFNTLVAAVQAADLVDTLSGEGPFTVFAPTDEAFSALPEGVLDKLLLPENKDVLAQILTYHVVAGEVLASDVKTGAVATVEGSEVNLAADAGTVTVNDATVVQADVEASNGVIHVLDTVILPPSLDLSTL